MESSRKVQSIEAQTAEGRKWAEAQHILREVKIVIFIVVIIQPLYI